MDTFTATLQIAVSAVGILGTLSAIVVAYLSHKTAIRALKLSEATQQFAHEERTAALRSALMNKRTEVYSDVLTTLNLLEVAIEHLAMAKANGGKEGIDHWKVELESAISKLGEPMLKLHLVGSAPILVSANAWSDAFSDVQDFVNKTPFIASRDPDRPVGLATRAAYANLVKTMRDELGVEALNEQTQSLLSSVSTTIVR